MTEPEARLWRALRAHRLDGLAFRRQVPVGPYIADFACHAASLVVEVDGWTHASAEELRRDAVRHARFADAGFRVLRVTNVDVMSNLEGVLDAILAAARERLRC